MTTVTVLGLGTMGGRLAARLVEHGSEVLGYDPVAAARQRAEGSGVDVSRSAEAATSAADLIVLSLPAPKDVAAAVRGPLSAASGGAVVADLSTIDPGTAREAAALLAGSGVGYVDAPVLGRPDRCGNWTLATGGAETHVERVREVLEGPIAKRVAHVGDVGAGSVVKLLNNLLFGAINAVTAEALTICRGAGISPRAFVETVVDSGAATVSPLFRELGPRLVDEDYDPTFALALLHKDNRLALQLAHESSSPAVVAACVDLVNTLAVNQGLGDRDAGAVYELYRRLGTDGPS